MPGHLDGRYLRIGPNPIAEVDPDHYHWFLGDGMVHGVRLRGGQAEWYRNRYVRSSDAARRLGEPPPDRQTRVGIDSSPNTNVIGLDGRTFALVEGGPAPYELTDELDTVGACDFDGSFPVVTPPTRTEIRTPANCTRCPTSGRGASGCGTRSSARTAGSGARSTSRSAACR